MFDVEEAINSETAANFTSEEDIVSRAVLRLQDAGFDVLQASEMTINIAGSAKTYEEAFGAPIVTEERPVIKEEGA